VDQRRLDEELLAQSTVLAEVVSGLAPGTTVVTCPAWSVRDLVRHVGSGHRWAGLIVTEPDGAPVPNLVVEPPEEQDQWRPWLIEGAQQLITLVRAGDPDRPVWSWRPERTARFWIRKLAHDTLIHRVDAELTAGRPCRIPAEVAADGVADLLDSIMALSSAEHPDPLFAALAGDGQRLQFVATDAAPAIGRWHVQRTPTGVRWHAGMAPAHVRVAGTTRDLLLVLNRRLDPTHTDLEIDGDPTILTGWLAGSVF